MQKRLTTVSQRLAARWTPPGGQLETWEELGVVVCRYSTPDGRPAACVYKGSSVRPQWNGPFLSLARREAYITGWKHQLEREQGMRASFQHQFEHQLSAFYGALAIGAIFYVTDGYEQTNAHFYEVVGTPRGLAVSVRELHQDRIESKPMAMNGHAVPRPGDFSGEAIIWRKKSQLPKIWNEGDKVRISWYS